jgi:hypothetical protein
MQTVKKALQAFLTHEWDRKVCRPCAAALLILLPPHGLSTHAGMHG